MLVSVFIHYYSEESRQKCGISSYIFGADVVAFLSVSSPHKIKACLAGWDAQFFKLHQGERVSKIVEHRGKRKVRRSRFFEREA